jgi:hypothetical protein
VTGITLLTWPQRDVLTWDCRSSMPWWQRVSGRINRKPHSDLDNIADLATEGCDDLALSIFDAMVAAGE